MCDESLYPPISLSLHCVIFNHLIRFVYTPIYLLYWCITSNITFHFTSTITSTLNFVVSITTGFLSFHIRFCEFSFLTVSKFSGPLYYFSKFPIHKYHQKEEVMQV
ncbi:hypothetical protein AAJ76_1350002250 [Vairimorpha ceranae]|uniref:Uncharacterized protein n=1 Tax=Vairimorpha ceranae TaxID=40302 RepID=A0A0F9WAS4_9MICR|nr:hypothetical protein AAJ76_1350002250 [Vairimorpha ceranae]KKO74025.1 hypothetical protein AAJ76_1350002250 [Vairimorpha ceranae]